MKTAERTPLPLCFVDVTRSLGDARIHLFVLHGPLEEAFARFAREQAVMVTGNLVAAHRTQFLDAFLRVGQLGTGGGRIDGGGRARGGHRRAADGHVLLETVHGAGHSTAAAAAVTTCGTEQIRCVHITQLITALVTTTHHRVRARARRGRLVVLGRHVLVQGRR